MSVVILAIDSPLHPLCGSFPRWGTRDESAGEVYCRKCSSPSPAVPELPGMILPLSSFSTCTIVQPPSRLWRQPPELRLRHDSHCDLRVVRLRLSPSNRVREQSLESWCPVVCLPFSSFSTCMGSAGHTLIIPSVSFADTFPS